MVQVKQTMDGERQYNRIQGPAGPIVYPAGFVYLFSAFYHLTNGGDILQGQILFAGLYVVSLAVVMTLYIRCKLPPYTLVLLCLSKRIHSIFLLRMFNDPVAMLGVYIMAWCLTKQRWTAAAVWFSLALSVKMNVLLFAPGLAFLLVSALGWMPALRLGLLAGVIQLFLGLPFLLTHPYEYVTGAFDFSRRFYFFWSVNWQFLGPQVFHSSVFSRGLLATQVVALLIFMLYRWTSILNPRYYGWKGAIRFLMSPSTPKNAGLKNSPASLPPRYVCWVLFTSNFIGVVFSRSLHYQFQSWYWWTLPFLLWSTHIHWSLHLGLHTVLEYVWTRGDRTPFTSATMAAVHVILLALLFWRTGKQQLASHLIEDTVTIHRQPLSRRQKVR
ncbi:dolichyl-P-Man:Man(5)GlcNAc(2)-PP-dolichol alpha-1,3-mannosyltransferase [Dispira simplex]|nr:dolichyl-P-Man:Man(5)GlcNAc(2)-PP-dolichol alpha-1,3-mannosyltransferase [Dispira simplex]